jgi:hypothetical protein
MDALVVFTFCSIDLILLVIALKYSASFYALIGGILAMYGSAEMVRSGNLTYGATTITGSDFLTFLAGISILVIATFSIAIDLAYGRRKP